MKAYQVKDKQFTKIEKAIEFAISKRLGSSSIYPTKINFLGWLKLKLIWR